MIPLSHIPERGDEVRIAYDGDPKTKHPAFIGHNLWTVLGFDERKGIQTKMGYFRSWVRVSPQPGRLRAR